MDSSSSSSGSTQHQALLSTVMELKADLERTMNKMQVMDEQNRSLTHSYGIMKEELIETRKKYNECRENYLNTVADKLADEERREEFNERLKLQLAEKTKEVSYYIFHLLCIIMQSFIYSCPFITAH